MTNSPSPDFLAGWQAAFDVVLEEMMYSPPSKVGEAKFFARLVLLKTTEGASNGCLQLSPRDPS